MPENSTAEKLIGMKESLDQMLAEDPPNADGIVGILSQLREVVHAFSRTQAILS